MDSTPHENSVPSDCKSDLHDEALPSESLCYVFDVHRADPHEVQDGTCEAPSSPNEHSDDAWIVDLSEGERLDGCIGTACRLSKRDSVLEYGEIYTERENTDSVPFLPDSVANLDLARLTGWGWTLFVGTFLLGMLGIAFIAQLLGFDRFPPFVALPTFGFLAVAFILGRAILESYGIVVLKRNPTDGVSASSMLSQNLAEQSESG